MLDDHADLLVSCKQIREVNCKHSALFRCDALNSGLNLDSIVLDGKMCSGGGWGTGNSTAVGGGGWGTGNSTTVGSWNHHPDDFLRDFVGNSAPAWVALVVALSDRLPVPRGYCRCMTACGRFRCQNRVAPEDVINDQVFRCCCDCGEGVYERAPGSSDGKCRICTMNCGCNHCVLTISESQRALTNPFICSIGLDPALEPIFRKVFAHPSRRVNLSRKSCKAYCKEPPANEHFDVHEWWATHILPDPYVENLEVMSPQEAENAIKPRTCLRILWSRLSSLLFTALRANVGNPVFSRHCLSLLNHDFIWDKSSNVPAVLANRNLSKFQVCCVIKAFRNKEAPVDLIPFLKYLNFWCKHFVKERAPFRTDYFLVVRQAGAYLE